MNKRVIDGVLKDWGDRLFYPRVRGKKGRNVLGGGGAGSSSTAPASRPSRPATRERLMRTLNKTPEVMVKITGGGKNMRQIETHMRYISREGEVDIEDENGDTHRGIDEVLEVRDGWAKGRIGVRPEGVTRMPDGHVRKEAFNLMLSMPAGTDRESVTAAARAFAMETFGAHQYVFASHDDEAHSHVHLAVKAVDRDGVRLRPRKGDLQHWRETFAEKLVEQGIAANATARRTRGIVLKAEKQAVVHINKGYEDGKRKEPARTTRGQLAEAEHEVSSSQARVNPAESHIKANRKEALHSFGAIARALAAGEAEDKQLALRIVEFVKAMPTTATRQDALVRAIRARKNQEAEVAHGCDRELGRDAATATEKDR